MTASARRRDPETSRLAADSIERTGRAQTQRAACLAEVLRNPGQTAAEIAEAIGCEGHVPSRRLPELRRDDLIENGIARPCKVKGSLSMTWYPRVKRSPGEQLNLFNGELPF